MAQGEITKHRVFVIGGSAGSLTIALKILPLLSPDNLSVLIVFHRKPSEDSVLIDILGTRTSFVIKEVDDKDVLQPGVLYLAPPDYHVLVEKDWSLTLDDSEKINYSRPSIDVTFESAAESCGDRLTCILLSGANADGAQGIAKAKVFGAKILIQDPTSADVPVMPQAALNLVRPDAIITTENLSELFEKY